MKAASLSHPELVQAKTASVNQVSTDLKDFYSNKYCQYKFT